MNELISGKEALIALANGEEVECRAQQKHWINAKSNLHPLGFFFDESFEFRLKPRTITINGIEVPAPFEPNKRDEYWFINSSNLTGYGKNKFLDDADDECLTFYGAWRNEDEIKQVVAALRSIFSNK